MTPSSRPLLSPLHTFSPLRHSSPRLTALLLLVVVSLLLSLLRAPSFALALSQDAIGSIIADSISFDGIGPGEDFGDYEERYGVSDDEDDYNADADAAGMGMEGVSMEWDEEQPEAAIHGVLDVDDVTLPKLADGRQKLLLLFYAAWDRFSKVQCAPFERAALLPPLRPSLCPLFNFVYEGERTAEAIVSYVLHGERRGPRLPALQAAVEAFRAGSSGEQREAAISQAEALVAGMSAADKDVGQLYIKAMKAAVAFGEDFLKKEARRLESSLEGGGLPPSTYTKFRQQIDIAKELDPTAAHE
ncbi:unnamed protein product [Closterium sp. NIES-54]